MADAPASALIVDDEPLARARLRSLLAAMPSVAVLGECRNGREAVAVIREKSPDIVFLDIQMPEMDGFGVVEAIGADRMPVVVFVTAYDEHALRAFEAHALDYILKPVSRARFEVAAARAVAQCRRGTAETRGVVEESRSHLAGALEDWNARMWGDERLAVKVDGKLIFLRTREIDWVDATDNHVRVHVGGKMHTVRATLSSFEERLPQTHFLRIHRSTILNMDRIREMQPWFQGDYVFVLTDGTRLTSGRSYRQRVHRFIERSS
ncbi:MAG: LytTR family DNA-binding domain-containing protein [Gemmatimonadota bacterium]|nr:LytTR family DNA-binding domain-containing protein [Gemmatimonadota bacterium]